MSTHKKNIKKMADAILKLQQIKQEENVQKPTTIIRPNRS